MSDFEEIMKEAQRLLKCPVWPHADPQECVCSSWPRPITLFTDFSRHHTRCEMYDPPEWVDDNLDQLDRSSVMKSLLAPVPGVNEPIEVTLPRDDGLAMPYRVHEIDYSKHKYMSYGFDLCKSFDLLIEGARLVTRDGAVVGNGIIREVRPDGNFVVETDFGNVSVYNEAEIHSRYTVRRGEVTGYEEYQNWRRDRYELILQSDADGLKEHEDLRRAVAIYCREHQPNNWENDQDAIDWFTDQFSEENYQ